jgi:hypothetical protein
MELLARNALEALRGPMSRGAVPTAELAKAADRPRTTVSRQIERQTGNHSATAFDLVAAFSFDTTRNGQRPRWESALEVYVASQGPPGLSNPESFGESIMKRMLGDAFSELAEGSELKLSIVGYLLHAAALLNGLAVPVGGIPPGDANGDGGAAEAARSAAAILDLRRSSYERTNAVYAGALSFVLSATRRRPKAGRSVEDLVVLLHCLFDGYMLRHALDRDKYEITMLVDVMWDLTISFTEPGFLAGRSSASATRDRLIDTTLEIIRNEHVMPDLQAVAGAAGLDIDELRLEFSDVEQLAEACLDMTCSHAIELRAIANEASGMARWTLQGFLMWLSSVVDDYGPLVAAAPSATLWEELASLVDMMLMSAAADLNPVNRKEIARKLVDVVKSGSDWEPALGVLLGALGIE